MNLWAVFLTGLTTGGLSCLAMQGGLLASIIANQKEGELEDGKNKSLAKTFDQLDWLPVSLFLAAKLVAHTILGFFLGWLGSKVEMSLTVRLVFQGLAALFMLATAGNLLDLHPIFRYVVLKPPRWMQRMVRNSTKGRAVFTPAVLGFLTIFIPCGVTQAMEVLAITSGSPVAGALIMFAFVLGTSPVFAMVGVAIARLSEKFKQNFMRVAAALLVFLGLSSINGILVVLDSPVSFNKAIGGIKYFFSDERFAGGSSLALAQTNNGVQEVLINVKSNGYAPNKVRVKAGIPVKLTLQTKNVYSCASSFVFKAFNIKMQLSPNDSESVTFTPTEKGKYIFTCSMGMYSGVMEVI